MAGVPMRRMADANAEPVAHHTPIPIPLHWQSDVKAGLDHDFSLGVLEPVPVGEPVTWCHRVVICTKKNGKPRRAVAFRRSPSMPREKPITHRAHFSRPVPYLVTLRRLSLTVGAATTLFPLTLMTATSPSSLPHGAIPIQNSTPGVHRIR